jgi:dienelactone hydrolase
MRSVMRNRMVIVLIFSCLMTWHVSGIQLSKDDVRVLDEPADEMMTAYLTELVDQQFAQRSEHLSQLNTAEDWQLRGEEIRSAMRRWTDLPDQRTPLNARVTGRLERDGYIVENVLFESRPSFFVSANLYLPSGITGRRPAILNVLGHNSDGKLSKVKQRRCIAQVKRGFVALIIDGIGQGERGMEEYTLFGSLPGAVHRTVGAQAFLAGTHLFSYMVWDAIRAVDYLCSRPEVDPEKIGITGTSGGGMMSTYILPFEPRISAAVPVCNPNTWSHRVQANLSTDHEQVFFGAFQEGIDPRGDPLFAHVPKPLLINATTDDNLNPPRGVWELHSWLYRAYSAFGQPDKLHTTMVDAGHDYNREQREITYAWMMRWLTDEAAPYAEEDSMLEEAENLWSSATGNVYDMEGSLEPQDLVRQHYLRHRAQLSPSRNAEQVALRKGQLAETLSKLMSLRIVTHIPAAGERALRTGNGWPLKPILLRPEEGILLPAIWLYADDASNGPILLFLSDHGKESLIEEKEIVSAVLREGVSILAVDLRGTGETAPGKEGYFWDFLAGKPISGQRVNDVLSVVTWLGSKGFQLENIRIWAQGLSGLWAAVACTQLEPLGGLVLENTLVCFEDVILTRLPRYNHEILLPGITTQMDIPDIYAALCPMSLYLVNPLRADKSPALRAFVDGAFDRTHRTYQNLRAGREFSVATAVEGGSRVQLITEALGVSMPD